MKKSARCVTACLVVALALGVAAKSFAATTRGKVQTVVMDVANSKLHVCMLKSGSSTVRHQICSNPKAGCATLLLNTSTLRESAHHVTSIATAAQLSGKSIELSHTDSPAEGCTIRSIRMCTAGDEC